MSAAVVILPRILPRICATSSAIHAVGEERASTMREFRSPHAALRKGPHSLKLVRASAQVNAKPELAFYRKYTEGMLRRYMKLSMEAGRVPSMLGQEMFRGKVTSYRVRSFEDVVIFVHDVGNCVARLEAGQQHLIRRIALEQYTQAETAAMLGISLRTVIRRYAEALDKLTRLFLERKMLEPLTACRD